LGLFPHYFAEALAQIVAVHDRNQLDLGLQLEEERLDHFDNLRGIGEIKNSMPPRLPSRAVKYAASGLSLVMIASVVAASEPSLIAAFPFVIGTVNFNIIRMVITPLLEKTETRR
jgi:hypothetical protein